MGNSLVTAATVNNNHNIYSKRARVKTGVTNYCEAKCTGLSVQNLQLEKCATGSTKKTELIKR